MISISDNFPLKPVEVLLNQTNEFQNWKTIYEKEVYEKDDLPLSHVRTIFTNQSCLVMPYLGPINVANRKTLLDNGEIRRALEAFASKGCIHSDIKWRHFRLWKKNVFLIDLGDIRRDQRPTEINDWYSTSLKYLQESIPTTLAEAPNTKSSGREKSGRLHWNRKSLKKH